MAEIALFVLNLSDIIFVLNLSDIMHAEIALKRVEEKHGILSEEKLGVLFQ